VPRDGALGDGESPWLLARTHPGLVLRRRAAGDLVALDVETPAGPVEELLIGEEAGEVIDFIVREPVFEVRALPGGLTGEERTAIADLLEETGLFTRTQP
jgi:hypothetical protein